jgi:cysteine desulfurase
VLNVSLPPSDLGDMLLFNLDIHKISASGGSACSSGSDIGSHVLRALRTDPERPSVRFSFSKFNTPEEVDYAAGVLAGMHKKENVKL